MRPACYLRRLAQPIQGQSEWSAAPALKVSGGIDPTRKARHPDHRRAGVPQGPQAMARDMDRLGQPVTIGTQALASESQVDPSAQDMACRSEWPEH